MPTEVPVVYRPEKILPCQPLWGKTLWWTLTFLCGLVSSVQAQIPAPDSFNPGANGTVNSFALQTDGKILVGGAFTILGGQTRNGIGRLKGDGTADATFYSWADNLVDTIAVQTDGKIVIGGSFATISGQPRTNIARLYADGTVDLGFNPSANAAISSLAVQADGKILLGGVFSMVDGQMRAEIARLNPDGTLDPTFNPQANNTMHSLALQGDGKILVGGAFSMLGGQTRSRIARLNDDGTLDAGFNAEVSGIVYSLAAQADGSILVGGLFNAVDGQSRTNIARVNASGTLDAGFNPGADGIVLTLVIQADGKILAGGRFTTLAGQPRHFLARLNSDGTVDAGFDPGANTYVYSLALQGDGEILAGGLFVTLGGQSRTNMGRLNNTNPASEELTFDGSTITWIRGGSSPEVWRTSFEASTNGTDWLSLGAGARLAGGWRVTGLALPSNATIRARGFVVGGFRNNSGWFVETMVGPPVLMNQPSSRTNDFGTTAVLSVVAIGPGPLVYGWRKDDVALLDGGNIAGPLTSTLTLNNVSVADTGWYNVVVSNRYGAVTSAVVLLFVNPAILDLAFDLQLSGYDAVDVFAQQRDGKILLGGSFATLREQPRHYIARLNPDGTLDAAFFPGANGPVLTLAVQADDKIVVGGYFQTLGGQLRNNIARLNADGTLDPTFNPGADDGVGALALQLDGKILMTGSFHTVGGQTRNGIARLNDDGTVDGGFDPEANGLVYSLGVQADGKIWVGGDFTTLAGQGGTHIVRLNTDGTADPGFNLMADGPATSVAPQYDGKILIGGYFGTLGGQARNFLARLNTDGSVDVTFNPRTDGAVQSLAVQTNGKILMSGSFTKVNDQARNGIARLNADGTLDALFDPQPDQFGRRLIEQEAGGNILLAGNFTTVARQARFGVARLINTELATQSLTFDGATVTWLRGGASPEVWRTTFERSTDGVAWISLGAGSRIQGGWQLSGLSIPVTGIIRARGDVNGRWFVENVTQLGLVNDQCASAIPMTINIPYTVNTANAKNAEGPSPSCVNDFGKGVWYAFTPSVSGPVVIETCGSDFDTAIQVYTGSCGGLAPVRGGCDDDDGPACNGSQGSVSFTGTAGTTYLVLAGGAGAASGNLRILASTNSAIVTNVPSGLTIIPIFDSTIGSDPEAAAIEATINSAIATYRSDFADQILISIRFVKDLSIGLGQSSAYYETFSYTDYRTALASRATSIDDALALAHLPNVATNPLNGAQYMNLNLSLARALGFNVNSPLGRPEGTIALKTSIMNLSADQTDSTRYSLFAVVCHEIDEVLGFASALNGLTNGEPPPIDSIFPEDLFRYDPNGNRSFTTAVDAAAYFSLDGVTPLARFNQHQGGDFHDWYSYYGGQMAQVQDAYATHGASPSLGVELRILDVIGYTRQFTILAASQRGGSISPSGAFTKAAGDSQVFTARPNANYAVNEWLMDGNVVQTGGINYTVSNIQASHSLEVGFTTVPSPALSLAVFGQQLIIRWPTNLAGLNLESATNLVRPVLWSAAGPSPVVLGGKNTVTNNLPNGSMFYRLKK